MEVEERVSIPSCYFVVPVATRAPTAKNLQDLVVVAAPTATLSLASKQGHLIKASKCVILSVVLIT
eukprot:3171108-Amphidinium_carterae.1